MLYEFNDGVSNRLFTFFVVESIEEGSHFDDCLFSGAFPAYKEMMLVDADGVTDTDDFMQDAIEVDELEIISISFDLSLIVFLYSLVEHIIEFFMISDILDSFLIRSTC